jgi:hypothetical protein
VYTVGKELAMSIRIGAIGVQKVSAKLMEHGFQVSLPVYDSGYDLITDWHGKMYRVQVKSTKGTEDHVRRKLKFLAVRGPGYGTMAQLSGIRSKKIYSKSDCDMFIFYHSVLDAMFIIPRIKVPRTKSIYLEPNCKWRDNWNVLK